MRKSWMLFFVISGICLFGCMSPKERTEEVIKEFKKEKVVLPYEDMSCWINDSIQHNRPWEQAKLKLVIYVDSTNCSECTLKTMYMWKDFVEMEQEYKPDFFLVYIFQTKKEIAPRALASEFNITELNHPMYIDRQSVSNALLAENIEALSFVENKESFFRLFPCPHSSATECVFSTDPERPICGKIIYC